MPVLIATPEDDPNRRAKPAIIINLKASAPKNNSNTKWISELTMRRSTIIPTVIKNSPKRISLKEAIPSSTR